jgi:hypothetical protein
VLMSGYIKMAEAAGSKGKVGVTDEEDESQTFRNKIVAAMQKQCAKATFVDDIDNVDFLKKALPGWLLASSSDKSFKVIHFYRESSSDAKSVMEADDRLFANMLQAIQAYIAKHPAKLLRPMYVICCASEPHFVLNGRASETSQRYLPPNPLDIMKDGLEDNVIDEDDPFLFLHRYTFINTGILVMLFIAFFTLPIILMALYLLFAIQAPHKVGKI